MKKAFANRVKTWPEIFSKHQMARHVFTFQSRAVLDSERDLANAVVTLLKNHTLTVVSMLLENLLQNQLQL